MTAANTEALAHAILDRASAANIMVATAESCTGGLISASLTDIPGSSAVVDRGFVTYTNNAKIELLGVTRSTLATHGAVSQETAAEMAEGALRNSRAQLAVSVTGIAGPGGGSALKPVGLVCFGLAKEACETITAEVRFGELGRSQVRLRSVETALELILSALPQ